MLSTPAIFPTFLSLKSGSDPMLNIPYEMQNRLDAGATTLAWCWRVERRDDQVFGFTDHDLDLTFDAVTYRAATGVSAADIECRTDRETASGEIAGAFNFDGLTEADLANGVWNGAQVWLFRVDWRDVSLRVKVWTGELGDIHHDGVSFRAELNGLSKRLERSVGRIFSRHCDASLGDARCGLDVSGPDYVGQGNVTAVSPTGIIVAGLDSYPDGWFAAGQIDWTSGAWSGRRQRVVAHRLSSGQVLLEMDSPDIDAAVGDTFSIVAGCDKRHATCRDKFANVVNFRGFATLPGNDVLMASPASESRRKGGSRGLV
jgi:uncharacterized phage protein (TIGR02218 family)